MQIQAIPIEELRPAPYNPRVALKPGDAGYERLARSIDEFELVQPPVWNERTGHIVGGHQRMEVLRHRGVTEVDCVVVDLPLEREQALNVALNNARVGSDWDPGKLVDLLDELQGLPEFDVTLTGFDEQQLRDLVLLPAESPPDAPCDAAGPDEEVVDDWMTIVLEMPEECWERVQGRVEALVADESEIGLHVRSGIGD